MNRIEVLISKASIDLSISHDKSKMKPNQFFDNFSLFIE